MPKRTLGYSFKVPLPRARNSGAMDPIRGAVAVRGRKRNGLDTGPDTR